MVQEVYIDPNMYVNQAKTSEDFELAGFRNMRADGKSQKFTDTEMRTLHNMFSKWSADGLNGSTALENFNRFYSVFPDMEMPADLKSYIFITRPEMNLLGTTSSSGSGVNLKMNPKLSISSDNASDTRLQYLAAMNPEILNMLTEDFSDDHMFIPYLQGRAESLQLPDYQIATSDFSVPFYSYKFAYPTVTNQSITGGTFDITFREDAELRITKLFQFWVYYMDAIMKNKMKPSRHHIINNYYDFMCSVYEIICDPTSEKILYWAKYTGCFPVSVPVSNLSHNLRSTVDNKVSITFQYIMVESLEPRVIEDFNTNVMKASGVPVPIYDTDFGLVTDTLVGTPFIELTDDQHGLILKWFPKTSGSKAKLSTSIPTLNNINVALNHANNYRAQVLAHRGSLGVDTSYKYTGLGNYLQNNSDSIP